MIVISILQMRKPRLRKLEDSGHYNDHDYTATVCVWLMKRPWFWERLRGGEGDNRGWDGWMASPTQWTRVWVNTGSWWWTGRPGVLQSVGSQRVAHDWATELNWTEWNENSEPLKHPKRTLQEWFMSKATHGLSFPSNPQICPLTSPWKFSGVLESVSLIFSPWPGKPWHMVKLSLQTLLSPLFTLFQMCCALSFMYSFSQYLLKTYYASDGSPENRMVSETDVLLDFLLPTVWSFPDWLHSVPSIHDPQPSYNSTACSPARQNPTDSQDPAHTLPPLPPSSTTWGWHSKYWAASWAIIMDTSCQPPVSQVPSFISTLSPP